MKTAPDAAAGAPIEITEDKFLDGRLTLRQPRRGHRAGLEAVLLAAAAPLRAGETLLDLGAGIGAAALCALARVPEAKAILVEGDPSLGELAADNVARNGFEAGARVVTCDICRRGAAARAGLAATADHAIANPPFYEAARSRISPYKQAAHAAPADALDGWARFAAAALKPGGTLTIVHRAAALAEVIDACATRFGDLTVLPLHPRHGQPAHRVMIQGTKGSRAPLCLLPGLVLHHGQGSGFRPEVEAALRGGTLSLADGDRAPHLNNAGDPFE